MDCSVCLSVSNLFVIEYKMMETGATPVLRNFGRRFAFVMPLSILKHLGDEGFYFFAIERILVGEMAEHEAFFLGKLVIIHNAVLKGGKWCIENGSSSEEFKLYRQRF